MLLLQIVILVNLSAVFGFMVYHEPRKPSVDYIFSDLPNGKLFILLNTTFSIVDNISGYLASAQNDLMPYCIYWNIIRMSLSKLPYKDPFPDCFNDSLAKYTPIKIPPDKFKIQMELSIIDETIVLPNTSFVINIQGYNKFYNSKIFSFTYNYTKTKPAAPSFVDFNTELTPEIKLKIRLESYFADNAFQYIITYKSKNMSHCKVLKYHCQTYVPKIRLNKGDPIEKCVGSNYLLKEFVNITYMTRPMLMETTLEIVPATLYNITAQVLNDWGYGQTVSKSYITSDYIAGPPTFVSYGTYFPDGKLRITISPSNPVSNVYEYIIIAQTKGMKSCILIIYTYLPNQPKTLQFRGKRIDKCHTGKIGNNFIKINGSIQSDMTVEFTNKSSIIERKLYILQTQARNEWGFGHISTVSFIAYNVPQPPNVSMYHIEFPSSTIKIAISFRLNASKTIYQYIVSYKSAKMSNCVLFVYICYVCRLKNSTNNGTSIDKCLNDLSKAIVKHVPNFLNQILIEYTDPTTIVPNISYKLQAQAVNNFGYGGITSKTLTTIVKQAEAPEFTNLSIDISSKSIKIYLNRINESNGNIFAYIVSFQSKKLKDCYVWIYALIQKPKSYSSKGNYVGNCSSKLKTNYTNKDKFPDVLLFEAKQLSLIKPYTTYIIKAQAHNYWGFGIYNETIYTSNSDIAEAPTFGDIYAEFPSGTIHIELNPTTSPNGKVFQHIIVLLKKDEKHCLIWIYEYKPNVPKVINNQGKRIDLCDHSKMPNNPKRIQVNTIQSDINIQYTNSSFVVENKTYDLFAQAFNDWGHGDIVTTSFIARNIFPDAPKFQKYFAEFPSGKLKIFLNPTLVPRGVVYQYIVSYQSDKMIGCILFVNNCNPCKTTIHSSAGKKIDICLNNDYSNELYTDVKSFPAVLEFEITDPTTIYTDTTYILKAQAVNQYSYGAIETVNFTTTNKQSAAPSFISYSLEYPSGLIKVYLKRIDEPSLSIFQYFITIQSKFMNSCFLWIYTSLINFPDKYSSEGNPITKCLTSTPTILETNVSSFPAVIKLDVIIPSIIKPFTNYTIKAQAYNYWGFGLPAVTYYITSSSIPSAPVFINYTIDYQFPSMKFYFTQSINPNGKIFQYLLTYINNQMKSCQTLIIYCDDCKMKITSKNGSSIDSCRKFPYKPTTVLVKKSFPSLLVFDIRNSSYIRPYTKYKLEAQARNAWGFGIVYTKTFTSDSTAPEPPVIINYNIDFTWSVLEVYLNQTTVPNGLVYQYIIAMIAEHMKDCDQWYYTCTQCTKQYQFGYGQIMESCYNENKLNPLYRIDKNVETFPNVLKTVVQDKRFVKKNTTYTIKVQSVNGWGYGRIASMIISTSMKQADAPVLSYYHIDFRKHVLEIFLNPPEKHNGKIYQYIVSVQSIDMISCILWIYNCPPFKSINVSLNGERIDICHNDKIKNNPIINETSNLFQSTLKFKIQNSDIILKNRTFTVKGQAVNDWGFGKIIEENIIVNGQKPSPPLIEKCIVNYSLWQMTIYLKHNIQNNQNIFKYIVTAQSHSMKSCILWVYNCPKYNPEKNYSFNNNSIDFCYKKTNDYNPVIYVKVDYFPSEILMNVRSNLFIRPYTMYTLRAQAVNVYGFGHLVKKSFTSPSYKPEKPLFTRYEAFFPSAILTIHLNAPTIPNGKIFQYLVTAQSNNMDSCILWIYTCFDCMPKKQKQQGRTIADCYKNNKINDKYEIQAKRFPSDLVFETPQYKVDPDSNYILKAQAVNAWGYGQISRVSYTTPSHEIVWEVCQNKHTSQTSTINNFKSSNAVDGNISTYSHTSDVTFEHWQVDLEYYFPIRTLEIINRQDCCQYRINKTVVILLDENQQETYNCGNITTIELTYKFDCKEQMARYVRIRKLNKQYLQLAEVKCFIVTKTH